MKYYLKVNSQNIIVDCVTMPVVDYIEFTGEIPIGVNGGWFKFENEQIVEYPELKPIDKEDKIAILEQEDLNNKDAIAELYMQVMMMDIGGM